MGGASSTLLTDEKNSWKEHYLKFNQETRQIQLRYLDEFKDGIVIKLCYKPSTWSNIKFDHWFVTNDTLNFEFGEPDKDPYASEVKFRIMPPQLDYHVEHKFEMDDAIRQKMRHILGMNNFSLCLRNSEHVANYVCKGQWLSDQTNEEAIKQWFPPYFKFIEQNVFAELKKTKMVNSFPSNIRPYIFGDDKHRIYSEKFFETNKLPLPFKATSFEYYLDNNEQLYNILVLGPTGAGKSHLINVLFNQKVCYTEAANLHTITKECYFIRGEGIISDKENMSSETRKIVAIDTAGFCDTEWSEKYAFDLIKDRISSNMNFIDAVFVVFNVQQRMELRHISNIKKMLNWLQYRNGENGLKFCFIGTHGDGLKEEEISGVINQATESLGILKMKKSHINTDDEIETTFVTGFPSSESEMHTDEQRSDVINSWTNLRKQLSFTINENRLNIPSSKCSIM